jgi:hypothetical protein
MTPFYYRQSPDYTPDLLLDAWRDYRARQRIRSSFTVTQLCQAYYARQVKEKRSDRTLNDDRWRLNRLAIALGSASANDCTGADLFQYLETIPPGSNRRSHFKTLKKLWRWAFQREDIEVDPMARMKPADSWGVNVEHLTPALYTQILRVIAGKESPAKGQGATNEYLTLLPYFVLAGLGGVRNCELIRYKRGEAVLQWADILWNKNLIFIRHEVAKETRARDRKRYIPFRGSSSRDFETSCGNWRSNALVTFLFSSEAPEACRRHANQITRKLLAQFVRHLCADVPVAWRRREGNGRPRGHCEEVLHRNT